MHTIQSLAQHLPQIEKQIGYVFKDKKNLVLAFVHRSYYNEHRDVLEQHNERLEFLGDSVLGILISDYLYHQLPTESEGQLSHLRAQIVEAGTCAAFLQKLAIGDFVLLGKGERLNEGKGRETIFADLFEAIVGAIYLDGGMEQAKQFLFFHFRHEIEKTLSQPQRNWKAELQDYCQKKYQKPPTYKVVRETGPDHNKVFRVVALIGEEEVGQGEGSSKKQAEQAAAENALISWLNKN